VGEGTFLRCGCDCARHAFHSTSHFAFDTFIGTALGYFIGRRAAYVHPFHFARAALSYLRFVVSVQFLANAGKTAYQNWATGVRAEKIIGGYCFLAPTSGGSGNAGIAVPGSELIR